MKEGKYVLGASSPWRSRDPWAIGFYAGGTDLKDSNGVIFFWRAHKVRSISGPVGNWILAHAREIESGGVNLIKAIKMAKAVIEAERVEGEAGND